MSGKACCGFLNGRKAKEKPFEQTVVVLRHSERSDQMDPKAYKESEMGQLFPWDGPLTKAGVQLAAKVGEELKVLHQQVNFSAIACSPYLRCLETAAEVAKLLQLPIMMDQEMAEVWEKDMPSTHLPHRSPVELQALATELGIRVANPVENGAIKLFGKPPLKHPEDLEAGHKRYLVRIENYIRLSQATKQNFIIVGHAPAVAAGLLIFERGIADLEKTDYCARIIARRTVPANVQEGEQVYAAHWKVEAHDVVMTIDRPTEAYMQKSMENMHMDLVNECETMVQARKERRTKTDKLFDSTIAAIAAQHAPEDDDGKDRA